MSQDSNLPVEGRPVTPIAIWKTKSFWFGWVPAALTLLDTTFQLIDTPAAVPVANSVSMVLSPFVDVSGEDITLFMKGLAPLYAFVIGYQRRGVNQPYTMNPAKESQVVAVVKEGTQAFQQGQAMGKVLKGVIRR